MPFRRSGHRSTPDDRDRTGVKIASRRARSSLPRQLSSSSHNYYVHNRIRYCDYFERNASSTDSPTISVYHSTRGPRRPRHEDSDVVLTREGGGCGASAAPRAGPGVSMPCLVLGILGQRSRVSPDAGRYGSVPLYTAVTGRCTLQVEKNLNPSPSGDCFDVSSTSEAIRFAPVVSVVGLYTSVETAIGRTTRDF